MIMNVCKIIDSVIVPRNYTSYESYLEIMIADWHQSTSWRQWLGVTVLSGLRKLVELKAYNQIHQMRLSDVRNVDESSYLAHESVPFLGGGEYCNRHMLHHDAAQMKISLHQRVSQS